MTDGTNEAERLARKVLAARVAAFASYRYGKGSKRTFIALATFVIVCGATITALSNYHSHSPFCYVAWDAWVTLDRYRSHHLDQDKTVNRLSHDLSSMEFHLAALRRAGDRKSADSYASVVADVSQIETSIEGGASATYETFPVQDLPTALSAAGCRGPAPR